jgi:alpha(1,3/1,4) fucosyltransferase
MPCGGNTLRTVAFRPPVSGLGSDRFFSDAKYTHVGDASHWMEPIRELAQIGARNGYDFHTDDVVDLSETDVLILGEVLMTPNQVAALKRRHTRLRIILQILETPLGRAWTFDPANHRAFDAILTYNNRLSGRNGYFIYNLPLGGFQHWKNLRPGRPWGERAVACTVMKATCPPPKLPRRSGLNMLRSGWRFTPRTWWNYATHGGSLLRERLCVASCLAKILPGNFDIYGPGWDTLGDAPIQGAWRGPWLGSKLDLLGRYRFNIAYENCMNDVGYVSEKVIDALLAGTVPVYLGNQRVQEVLPQGSFVDARRFELPRELAAFLEAMPKQQWEQMRAAGDEFLCSDAEKQFGAAQYTGAVMRAVKFVLPEAS